MTMTLNSVQATMTQCRRRLRNRATLRNLTDLSPVLPCTTRWFGYARTISRYNRLRKELIILTEDENTDLRIDTTLNYTEMLLELKSNLKKST